MTGTSLKLVDLSYQAIFLLRVPLCAFEYVALDVNHTLNDIRAGKEDVMQHPVTTVRVRV